jgi:lipopolysaccharide/colanic/teichoic acid biosynthesis glycosyltransferase
VAKRAFDLAAAICGLIVLSPLLLALGLAVRLNTPGTALHRAQRCGLHGRLFTLYKFRTMVEGAAAMGPGITGQADPRVTRVGRLLRRTKLDELPQLLNVVRGDMSLVGPRPEDPRYVAGYTPQQRHVLSVRPGITSWASLRYRNEERLLTGASVESEYRQSVLPKKLALDLEYIQERSLWLDLRIIVSTILTLAQGEERKA